jgi:aerobic carbon-monoxide dehydrogenase small subunit
MTKVPITVVVNGEARTVSVWPMERLLDVIRVQLGLTGTKEGCGEGECGACSILLDGQVANSCLIPAVQADGSEITTIEGIECGKELAAVQRAFLECGAAQCGICTPGMIVATVALLRQNPQPTEAELRQGLAGNLCRCTGYLRIFEAVRSASRRAWVGSEPKADSPVSGVRWTPPESRNRTSLRSASLRMTRTSQCHPEPVRSISNGPERSEGAQGKLREGSAFPPSAKKLAPGAPGRGWR